MFIQKPMKLQRLPLTRALKGLFLLFKPAFWRTSINRYHGFSRVGLEKILSPFIEHFEEYVGVSAVFATFCCRIWHRFMSRLRGERICWVFFGGNSNYRHSYNNISFVNRSQLVWVLASSGFYSITWRMISTANFIFENSLHSEETFSLFSVISFVSLNLY